MKTALAIRPVFRNLTGLLKDASVAQLVEHHLAKVNVEGSNPFARSILPAAPRGSQSLYIRPNQPCIIEAAPMTAAPTHPGMGVRLRIKIRIIKPYRAN